MIRFIIGRPSVQTAVKVLLLLVLFSLFLTSLPLPGQQAGGLTKTGVFAFNAEPIADPGNLVEYRGRNGEIFLFSITGDSGGSVWGTDIYTDDSDLATAAVHAGQLTAGETGVVRVRILPGQDSYQGSTRHGVTSGSWGQWSGSYEFLESEAPPASLDGRWLRDTGYGVEISGSSGVFYALCPAWQNVADKGYISIGSLAFKEIKQISVNQWELYSLWWWSDSVQWGVAWSEKGTITMSSDGNEIVVETEFVHPISGTRMKDICTLHRDEEAPAPQPSHTATLFWQHQDGSLKAWLMDGTTRIETKPLTPSSIGPGWQAKAVVDMNGNGQADIVWQHADGRLKVWYMDGLVRVDSAPIRRPTGQVGLGDPNWQIKAVYDLNDDGSPDIIFQYIGARFHGQLAVWLMDGLQADRFGRLYNTPGNAYVNPLWEIGAVYDLLGDGQPEVIWQSVSGGDFDQLAYWQLNVAGDEFTRSASGRLTQIGGSATIRSEWRMRTAVDLLDDGRHEILFQGIRGLLNGRVSYWQMEGIDRKDGGPLVPRSVSDPRWRLVGSSDAARPAYFEATSIGISPPPIGEEVMPYYPEPDVYASILIDICAEGPFEVSYTVTNTGSGAATEAVAMNALVSFDYGLTWHLVGGLYETSLTLAAGQSNTVTRSFNGEAGGMWKFELVTANDEAEYWVYIDEDSPAEAYFAVSFTEIPAEVKATEEARVRFRVENSGGAAGEQRVKVYVDETYVGYADISLSPGEGKNYYFDLKAAEDVGHTYNVTISSDDSSVSGTVKVIPIVTTSPPLAAPWVLPTSPHPNYNSYPAWAPEGTLNVFYKAGLRITGHGSVPYAKVVFKVTRGEVQIDGYDDGTWVPDDPFAMASWVEHLETWDWWPPWIMTTPPSPQGFPISSSFDKVIPLAIKTTAFEGGGAVFRVYVVDASTPYPHQIISD